MLLWPKFNTQREREREDAVVKRGVREILFLSFPYFVLLSIINITYLLALQIRAPQYNILEFTYSNMILKFTQTITYPNMIL